MNINSWNGYAWNGIGVEQPPITPLPPPPPIPLPLPPQLQLLRKSTRYVGVHNATIRQESIVVNQESRVFFEYGGVSGIDKVHPQDVHCKNFKVKTLPGD